MSLPFSQVQRNLKIGLAGIGHLIEVKFGSLEVDRHVVNLVATFHAKHGHLKMIDLRRVMFANAERRSLKGWSKNMLYCQR